MKRKTYYRIFLITVFFITSIVLFFKTNSDMENSLPETIFMDENSETAIETFLPVSASCNFLETKPDNQLIIKSDNEGIYRLKYNLFGLIPIKAATIYVKDRKEVYPMGLHIGMYLHTDGVMVIDTGDFVDLSGNLVNPSKGKIKKNDYIIKFNGIDVNSKNQLTYLIKRNKESSVTITVNRSGETKNIKLYPVISNDNTYKLGIWVRDDMQGIGTMTYIDGDNKFGALGHGINDIDTGRLLDSTDGKIYNARIWGVRKGQNGIPGGLCGTIDYVDENVIGEVNKNSEYGIFGTVNNRVEEKIKYREKINLFKIGFKQEIKKGRAKIQVIENNNPVLYDVEIEKINISDKNKDKNMIIKITDERLLKKTNGIVQGMSGSPIIQNGKIVGAITHVFVNDSKRGYAIFIERMIEEGSVKVGKGR